MEALTAVGIDAWTLFNWKLFQTGTTGKTLIYYDEAETFKLYL